MGNGSKNPEETEVIWGDAELRWESSTGVRVFEGNSNNRVGTE